MCGRTAPPSSTTAPHIQRRSAQTLARTTPLDDQTPQESGGHQGSRASRSPRAPRARAFDRVRARMRHRFTSAKPPHGERAEGALHGFLGHPSGTRWHNARHHESAATQDFRRHEACADTAASELKVVILPRCSASVHSLRPIKTDCGTGCMSCFGILRRRRCGRSRSFSLLPCASLSRAGATRPTAASSRWSTASMPAPAGCASFPLTRGPRQSMRSRRSWAWRSSPSSNACVDGSATASRSCARRSPAPPARGTRGSCSPFIRRIPLGSCTSAAGSSWWMWDTDTC